MTLSFQGCNLLASSVSDRVPGESLFARFHELFGPGIEGSWFDTLLTTQIADGYFSPEPLQDDADLHFWSVLSAGSGSDLSDEGPSLLGMSFRTLTLVYIALGHFGSFLDVDTLYPASGALTTSPSPVLSLLIVSHYQ